MPKENQLTNEIVAGRIIEGSDFIAPAIDLSSNSSAGTLAAAGSTDCNDVYIKKWHRSVTILHQGHWNAARYYERVNRGLGIATALAATISGTTAFTQLQNQTEYIGFNFWIQIGVGIFALTAAAFGAVQASIRPSELAGRHKQAAQKFGKLRREIEVHLDVGLPSEPDRCEKIHNDIRIQWDKVDEESLPLPKHIYDKAENKYKKEHTINS